ncbi:MAG: hypothetical protein GC204_14530 [Chloroflexi bacterium]|nr:hypothetical protein [Chloroflexota bacterium]
MRFVLRLALLLTLLLSGALLATHVRPLDPALDDLLGQSPGCEKHGLCYMGIYPGASTIDQAAAALRAHPWVAEVDTRSQTQVTWTWSGQQPAYIDEGVPGAASERDAIHISLIRVKTRFNYGDIWLQLGTPQQGYALRQPDGFLHGVYYTRYSLLAINSISCPASMQDFWTMPVIAQFGDAFVMLDSRYREQSAHFRAC